MKNFPLLTSEDIEVKVKQCVKTGALLLLYKTSRTDAKVLDECVGPLNWTCDYKTVKDTLYCGIGIKDSDNPDASFIWKWNSGIESDQEDGNERKAETSDAFKRCASLWGIGRELYSSPKIWANISTVQKGDKYYLADPNAKYVVTEIAYNEETRVITRLVIANAKTNTKVFDWTMPTSGAMGQKMVKTVATADVSTATSTDMPVKSTETPVEAAKEEKVDTASNTEKTPLKTLIHEIGQMVAVLRTKGDEAVACYGTIVKEVTGDNKFKCNVATEDQYDTVLAIHSKLKANPYVING